MAKIKFKIAAKTDVGLVRTNNEDNFQASSDLLVKPMRWVNNEVCQLGDKGALLVVADGMGGMNAGEVASQIAIDTIREGFDSERLTPEVMKNRFTIEKFMNEVIVKADNNIKAMARQKPDTNGMGTTIVIAWLLENSLYISWCGDSRAYVYNPKYGLHRLTKDHSYVQQLVDAGKLSEEEAFDYPDSNIITRCLSDSKQKAQPESLWKPYHVVDNDIIMLCTDGLFGMIRDAEILPVIESNVSDLKTMSERLIQAALNASGADNVTVCLCQIISGGAKSDNSYFTHNKKDKRLFSKIKNSTRGKKNTILLCLLFLIVGGLLGYFIMRRDSVSILTTNPTDSFSSKIDTVRKDSVEKATVDTISKEKQVDENENIHYEANKRGVDNHLGEIKIPNTDNKLRNSSETERDFPNSLTPNSQSEEQSETLTEEIRDIVKERLPEGIHIQQFARQHGMNFQDMKRLNPNIQDWSSVQPGTILNVYKNK